MKLENSTRTLRYESDGAANYELSVDAGIIETLQFDAGHLLRRSRCMAVLSYHFNFCFIKELANYVGSRNPIFLKF